MIEYEISDCREEYILAKRRERVEPIQETAYYTLEELADRLAADVSTVHRWRKAGLKVCKIGSGPNATVRVKGADAIEFLDSMRVKSAPESLADKEVKDEEG